jgi:hypothetical protein
LGILGGEFFELLGILGVGGKMSVVEYLVVNRWLNKLLWILGEEGK